MPRAKQAEFQVGYVWMALAVAIFGGFALAGHLAFLIGFNQSLGDGFASHIQIHGHLQLIGWAGLFIIGISLHFIPRLSSVPISQPQWIPRLLWFIGIGLLLRFISHPILPYLNNGFFFMVLSWITVASGFLEWYGVLIYLALIASTIFGISREDRKPPLMAVRPYFGMMLLGFFLYATIHAVLLLQMGWRGNVVVGQAWNEVSIHIFIDLVLLPVAFGLSIRMFPLYLRLPAVDWPVRRVAYVYLIGFLCQISKILPINFLSHIGGYISSVGMLIKAAVILYIVWKLDVLTRIQEPAIGHRDLQSSPDHRQTRRTTPDHREFGRFEWHIYAAYGWLVFGALAEMLVGGFGIFQAPFAIGTDVIRHIYLLGFITNLIMGMAVRMVPGFLKKRRIASTKLIDGTFWLINIAVIGRVLPLLLPLTLSDVPEGIDTIAQAAFGLSGILGLLATICFAINLWKTTHSMRA